MSISKAIQFVNEAVKNKHLRDTCNETESKMELLDELGFDETEFEDAINMQLVKCQSYEQAEVYQQIKMWFMLL